MKKQAMEMKPQEQDAIEVTSIRNCARCGCSHDKLTFMKLKKPSGEFTHWAICPQSEQPIMMKIVSG